MDEEQRALPVPGGGEEEAEVPDQNIYFLDSDDPWSAKPLTLAGTLKLLRFVGELAESVGVERGRTFRLKDFLERIDKRHLLTLLSFVTAQDEEWLEANFDFPKAMEAIVGFWEINALGELLGKLMGPLMIGRRAEEGGEEGES